MLGEDLYQGMIRTARHPGSTAGRDSTFDDLSTAFLDDSAGFGHVRADTALKFFAPPRQIYHQRITGLTVIDTITTQRTLRNVPGLPNPDSVYTVKCYVLRKTVTFSPAFVTKPFAWARSSGTAGVKDVNPHDYNEEVNFGRIVALSATQCTVETNVFEVLNLADPSFHFWLPLLPTKAAVALTLVGAPAGGGPFSSGPAPSETGHDGAEGAPAAFVLLQCQPNPLSGQTTIRFELPVRTAARLDVFDAQGRLVRTLANAEFPRGLHAVIWDGRDREGRAATPGIYLYRLRAGSFHDQKKIMLLAR